MDVAAAVDFVKACKNFDGGFGCTPGMEGAGQQLCTGCVVEGAVVSRCVAAAGPSAQVRQTDCAGLPSKPLPPRDGTNSCSTDAVTKPAAEPACVGRS